MLDPSLLDPNSKEEQESCQNTTVCCADSGSKQQIALKNSSRETAKDETNHDSHHANKEICETPRDREYLYKGVADNEQGQADEN